MKSVYNTEDNMKYVILIDEAAESSFEGVVGYNGLGWYFWDETETTIIGPFNNSEEAETGLQKYAESI